MKRLEYPSTFRFAVSLAVFLGAPALAGGFALGTQTAEAVGVASAVTARPASRSAAFYNPAASTGLKGLYLSAGGVGISSAVAVSDPRDTSAAAANAKPSFRPAPHLLISYSTGDLAATLFLGAPFGSGVAFDPAWRGRFEVTEINLRALSANANLAYRLHPKVSVAAGVQYVSGTLEIRRQADVVTDEIGAYIGGSGKGLGVTASLHLQPKDSVFVGLSYRSAVHVPFEGQVDFTEVPRPFAFRSYDQAVRSSVRLPDRWALGTHFLVSEDLSLSFDLEYYRWRTFRALSFDFEDDALDRSVPREWFDSFTPRFGGEYKLTSNFTARAGAYFDPRVSPDDTLSPSSPDADRFGAALGLGFQAGKTNVDFGYTYVKLLARKGGGKIFPASYDGGAHLVSLTFGQRF